MDFLLLQAQFNISRSLYYSIFFLPVLLFALYALLSSRRAQGTRNMLDEAVHSLATYNPKLLREGGDISLAPNHRFLQPVAFAKMELPEMPFKSMEVRVCRSMALSDAGDAKAFWEVHVETRTPLPAAISYRIPRTQEENPMFVQRTATASVVDTSSLALDPICMKLNSDLKLMAAIAELSPSEAEVVNSKGASIITIKFESSEPKLNSIVLIANAISSVGSGDAAPWAA